MQQPALFSLRHQLVHQLVGALYRGGALLALLHRFAQRLVHEGAWICSASSRTECGGLPPSGNTDNSAMLSH
jgi:hypothetical protein